MHAVSVLALLALALAHPGNLEPDPRLPSMRSVVVLDDPLAYELPHVKNSHRLRSWLTHNGATALDTEALVVWIEQRIAGDDAYGTAVVLTYGILPAELVDSPSAAPAWLRYLKRGGRIVNVGGAPMVEVVTVTGQPRKSPKTLRARLMLGLHAGWNNPYWGRHAETRLTAFGRAWGIENRGDSIVGIAADQVSMAFHTYTARDGSTGASNWFKNFSPEHPWGGLIHLEQTYDGTDDSILRDTWRAAYFVGRPLRVPPAPSPPAEAPKPTWTVRIEASGYRGRSSLAVGEAARFVLEGSARSKRTRASFVLVDPRGDDIELSTDRDEVVATWDSSGHAPGEYSVEVTVKRRKEPNETVRRTFDLARPRPSDFAFQMWTELRRNTLRNRRILERIRSAGMDVYLSRAGFDYDYMDQTMAAGLSFSGRLLPSLSPPGASDEAWLRIDIDGTPMRYPSGQPKPSLTHPAVLDRTLREFGDSFRRIKDHPAFMGVILTNDDYSAVYGWDFADHMAERFENLTGRRPPDSRPDPPTPGVVEDDDLWLAWNRFSVEEISGRFNRMQQEALEVLRPGTRVGPISGPTTRPLFQMDQAAQYPPLNFGRSGFPLISFYYYNGFWAPLLANTYWTEVARMGNRDLPIWVMPDCVQGGAVYARNNAYHLLAGGVRGMVYFRDVECRAPQWQELERLGRVVSRISPIQAALEPADRRVALLISFTTSCFEPTHPHRAAYGYHHLMQAGYSVDVIAEEEVLSGAASRYDAIVLHDVGWLRRSVADALTSYARAGSAVLLDASVPFEIEGAESLGVELGSGLLAERGADFERGAGRPAEYGKIERIADVRRLMAAHVDPDFDAQGGRVVVTGFRVGETRYWWVVDTMDEEAYRFGFERNARRGDRDPLEAMRELWAWDEAALARDDRVVQIHGAPRAGAVYDVANGRHVPVTPTESGSTITLRLPRFGGALLAFVDEPVGQLSLETPANVRRGDTVEFRARLLAGDPQSGWRPPDAVLPVEFELLAPDGSPHDGNRAVGASKGEALFSWTPAVNDPTGAWTLSVQHRASGHNARATIQLK